MKPGKQPTWLCVFGALLAHRYIPVLDTDEFRVVRPGAMSFDACVQTCVEPCQFVTYDYQTQQCVARVHQNPVYTG
jgi:hypothetical protein